VAIKVLAEGVDDPVAARRFDAEARILARLRHPNTVGLIDFGRLEDTRPYLVSPLLEGATLRARLDDGPLPVAFALDVVAQVARALEEAHELGVVHRDLKPANIFLEQIARRTVVRVIDFGIAQQEEEDLRLTAEDHTIGTAAYMSPEQVRGERVDARSDVYSLGVVAYECLSGAPPFDGPNRLSVLMQHLNDAPPPLEGEPPVVELVDWCLEKRPVDRPPDAAAVLDALDELRDTASGRAVGPAPRRRVAIKSLVAGLTLGLAVMGALAGWALDGRRPGETAARAPAPPPKATPAEAVKEPLGETAPKVEPPVATPPVTVVQPVAEPAAPPANARKRLTTKRRPKPAPEPTLEPAPLVEPTPPDGLF